MIFFPIIFCGNNFFLISSRFMVFPTFLEKIKLRRGTSLFLKKLFLISSCFMLFLIQIFFLGNIEKCPFTYWLNGRWFLQIVDRQFEHGVKWKVVSPDTVTPFKFAAIKVCGFEIMTYSRLFNFAVSYHNYFKVFYTNVVFSNTN